MGVTCTKTCIQLQKYAGPGSMDVSSDAVENNIDAGVVLQSPISLDCKHDVLLAITELHEFRLAPFLLLNVYDCFNLLMSSLYYSIIICPHAFDAIHHWELRPFLPRNNE